MTYLNYRPEIDGLRGLAVLLVILFHAGFDLFSGGYVGVDVFFVISGYLITSLIYKQLLGGVFSFADFYQRRIQRLLPALYFMLISLIPIFALVLFPTEFREFLKSILATIFFHSNFYFVRKIGHFESAAELKPLLHTWSLSIEEQFYFLFPLFLFLSWKVSPRLFKISIIVMTIASFCASVWLSSIDVIKAYFLPTTRIWELGIGAICALFPFASAAKKHSKIFLNSIFLIGLFAILVSATFFDKGTLFPGALALVPTLGTAMIILASQGDLLLKRILTFRPLVFLGLISYSLYLWHNPVFVISRLRTLNSPTALTFSLLIVLSILIAYFSWRLIENPFRKTIPSARRKIFFLTAFVSALISSISLLGITYSDLTHSSPLFEHLQPDYLPRSKTAILATTGNNGDVCISEGPNICIIGIFKPGRPNVLLLGDSHSADLTMPYRDYLQAENLNGWQMSIGGCALLSFQMKSKPLTCGAALTRLNAVLKSNLFHEVYFVGNFNGHLANKDLNTIDQEVKALAALISELARNTKHLFVFESRLNLNVDPIKAQILSKADLVKVLNSNEFDQIWRKYFNENTRPSNFEYFKQNETILNLGCNDVNCFNGHDLKGNPLYRDQTHLTDMAADRVWAAFIDWRRLKIDRPRE